MRIGIFNVLLFFFILSCDTNVDFEGKEYPTEPVVYAHLNADSTVEARISYSAPVRGEFASNREINDAKVVLIENGKDSIRLKLISEGKYQASYIPDLESHYKLWVKTDYGSMLSSTVQIPVKPSELSSSLEPYQKGFYNYTDLLRTKWEVGRQKPQFLKLQVGYADSKQFQSIRITSVEDALISACGGFDASDGGKLYFIGDVSMNGQRYECIESDSLEMSVAFNRDSVPEGNRDLLVKFATTSPQYHEFEAQLIDYRAIDLFFEEPVPPYTNFDNGYGYFAAFNEVTISLNL
ncbi:DUF4249 family protein [Marivirga harenae]|uniref:DUF4249 family protein n=1 Tax=Marivirga harenae TaxID=2010992 RepID=UPI0026E01196|nr:DUF4249 family protein [Marivirga harenae]WKV10649.1 DUF4249 family protein [Marivirga harenae]|tara:strand:+ start:11686 stop:12567 length:882 start_codon:yes stop_codon:yes gene_type:complete